MGVSRNLGEHGAQVRREPGPLTDPVREEGVAQLVLHKDLRRVRVVRPRHRLVGVRGDLWREEEGERLPRAPRVDGPANGRARRGRRDDKLVLHGPVQLREEVLDPRALEPVLHIRLCERVLRIARPPERAELRVLVERCHLGGELLHLGGFVRRQIRRELRGPRREAHRSRQLRCVAEQLVDVLGVIEFLEPSEGRMVSERLRVLDRVLRDRMEFRVRRWPGDREEHRGEHVHGFVDFDGDAAHGAAEGTTRYELCRLVGGDRSEAIHGCPG